MLYMTFFYIYPSRIMPSDLFSWFSKIQIPKPVRGCGKQNFMSVSGGVLSFSAIVENIFCIERSHINMIIYNPREGGSLFLAYLNVARYVAVPSVETILWYFTVMQQLALKQTNTKLSS